MNKGLVTLASVTARVNYLYVLEITLLSIATEQARIKKTCWISTHCGCLDPWAVGVVWSMDYCFCLRAVWNKNRTGWQCSTLLNRTACFLALGSDFVNILHRTPFPWEPRFVVVFFYRICNISGAYRRRCRDISDRTLLYGNTNRGGN